MARTPFIAQDHPHYKWVALSNTTLGMPMATINASIVIISLPAIFTGIRLDPLQPGNVSYLLWILMGYMLVTALLVVTFGGQPGRPARRHRPRRAAVHAHHLVGGHLAAVARLRLRGHATVRGHLHAADHGGLPYRRAGVRHPVRPVR